ncbi:MAG TPA: response regulator [Candidatus Hydrogenedentes bacterium]|jgi:signal transduction histidine kinase|nr:response regulator [Candidatus Hydrogenedentota bacterium]HQN01741.1 response regulator [Candidatus Hydrogenedentota bacterium]
MKILVADDDSMIRMLIERQLVAWGHEVRTAADGAEAMREIEKDDSLQVLLLDWMMPGLDGLEVCRRTRQLERNHYMFIVLITSRSGKENFLTGMSAGADDFMTKPLDADELLVRMHSAERVIHLQSEAQIQAAIAAELREIDRMKSTFISLTSHELRSPLSLILLNLELLSTNKALRGTDCQKTIVSLSANAQRLWRIVEETLKASKNGKYVKELNLEPVDINVLIRDTVNGVTPFAALRSQHIEVETEMDFPEIWLDPGKISDALANLLMNAIKFTPDNMTIQVKACREDSDAIRISVIDPGMGVSDIDKPHMFEQLFSTLDITHHSSGYYEFGKRGIGLGLAIVKDFVEMHGGTVGFESEEGHGSCFHLTIPIAP